MLWLTGLLLLAVTWLVIMPIYFKPFPKPGGPAQLAAKAAPTLLAALTAAAAYAQQADRYALWVMIALLVCTAADVMLGVKFVIGGALFLTGHMLYIFALSGLMPPSLWSVAVFALAVILLWLFCRRYFSLFPNKLLYLGVLVYCVALGALVAFSLPVPFAALSRRAVLAALGAMLFVVSDMGTCHAMLTPAGRRFNYISLGVYYTAQLLLGFSAFA